ncbi:MAG TPA: hypothetical protein VFW40_04485 [Capsulimonadaceae bacterium]|nr:hypothetical protein [Capsulimonadaceae bacterium]
MPANWRRIALWGLLALAMAGVVRVFAWSQERAYGDEIARLAPPAAATTANTARPADSPAERLLTEQGIVKHPVIAAGGKVVRMRIRAGGPRRRYRVVDLGQFDWDPYSNELNLNNTGKVTICSDDRTAYLWKKGRRMTLPTTGKPQYTVYGEGPVSERVRAVNDHDMAVGGVWDEGSGALSYWTGVPVVWKHGILAKALPVLPGLTNASGVDINDQGVALCQDEPDNNMEGDPDEGRAYLVKNGTVENLGEVEGSALNNRGEVVGQDTIWDHALLLTHGHWIDLGRAFKEDSQAEGVNDHADAAGTVGDEAYLWREGAGRRYDAYDLGPGAAFGINNRGEIVGRNNQDHAVLWRGNRVIDLNRCVRAKGWVLQLATHINQRGWIVGFGLRYGDGHGFLLIPVG